ncbi:hypothetical protein PIB30_012253 [Stylosanthes scabra]|uniref:Uncharacterized protein n=1 Tax=Stylosanthes scabra TaxID=79078 RepID=A0ABU6W659_9FABA|nr:hypothetical protein [Stylosanthes scabra]
MVLNTLANSRASTSRGTQLQPLSEAITKPRHLSEGFLPEDKHPGSGDYWTDNISEPLVRLVYRNVYFGLRLLLSVLFLRSPLATPCCDYLYLNQYLTPKTSQISGGGAVSISDSNSFTSNYLNQSLRSTWGERVSSMHERLINFKAQLTSQRMSSMVYGTTSKVVRDQFLRSSTQGHQGNAPSQDCPLVSVILRSFPNRFILSTWLSDHSRVVISGPHTLMSPRYVLVIYIRQCAPPRPHSSGLSGLSINPLCSSFPLDFLIF